MLLIQLVLLFATFNIQADIYLLGLGWFLLLLGSFLMFHALTGLQSLGGIDNHDSISKTNLIIRTGLYGVIQHPMYLGYLCFSIAQALVSQHWLSIICSFFVVPFVIILMIQDEELNKRKFGEDYVNYQAQIPRINIIEGAARYVARKYEKRNIE